MKTKHKLVSAFLLLGMLTVTAVQAEAVPEITISVSVQNPADSRSLVQLEAEDAAFPMPENAEAGICRLSLQQEGTFLPIQFRKPGIYRYRVRQLPGEDAGCQYDQEEYHLQITVTGDRSGELTAVMTGTRNGRKTDQLLFRNTPEPQIPQTGESNLLGSSIAGMMFAAAALTQIQRKRK